MKTILILVFLYAKICIAAQEPKHSLATIVEKQVSLLSEVKSAQDWIKKSPGISKAERKILLLSGELKKPLPEFRIVSLPGKIVLSSKEMEADLGQLHKGILIINGRSILIGKLDSLFEIAGKINTSLIKNKREINLTNLNIFSLAYAADDRINKSCIHRLTSFTDGATELLDSPAGFWGPLWVASIIVEMNSYLYEASAAAVGSCKKHVKEIKSILEKNNLGIKEIDCGSDRTGTDRSIEFWIPEKDGKKIKTKKFLLNYAKSIAQLAPAEEENEDDDGNIKAEITTYFFGSNFLKKISQRKIKDDEYKCEFIDNPNSPEFIGMKNEIEKYREIFYYIGQNFSCSSCEAELSLHVETPKAPQYVLNTAIESPQKNTETHKGKKLKRAPAIEEKVASAKDEDEDDEEETPPPKPVRPAK